MQIPTRGNCSGWAEDDSWNGSQKLSSVTQEEDPPWQVVKPQSNNSWSWVQQHGGGFYSMQQKLAQRNMRDMTPCKMGRQNMHTSETENMSKQGVQHRAINRWSANRFGPLSSVSESAASGSGYHRNSKNNKGEGDAPKQTSFDDLRVPPGLEPIVAKTQSDLSKARALRRQQKKERQKEYKHNMKETAGEELERDDKMIDDFMMQDAKKQIAVQQKLIERRIESQQSGMSDWLSTDEDDQKVEADESSTSARLTAAGMRQLAERKRLDQAKSQSSFNKVEDGEWEEVDLECKTVIDEMKPGSISMIDYKSRHEGISIPTLSALGSYKGWQEIIITIDSGACDTVMPLSLCGDIQVIASMQSRSGLEYEVANGESIPNEGERKCLMMTRGAQMPKRTTFQVADVHKTLMSITRAADAGYECHLNAKGGWLLDTFTGETIPIARGGNLYTMRAWIKGDPNEGFARQG